MSPNEFDLSRDTSGQNDMDMHSSVHQEEKLSLFTKIGFLIVGIVAIALIVAIFTGSSNRLNRAPSAEQTDLNIQKMKTTHAPSS